jgi:hypothetical protein
MRKYPQTNPTFAHRASPFPYKSSGERGALTAALALLYCLPMSVSHKGLVPRSRSSAATVCAVGAVLVVAALRIASAAGQASLYWFGGAVPAATTYYHVGNTQAATDADFVLPSGGSIANLEVVCDASVDPGTYTFTLEVNDVAAGLTCELSGQECADTQHRVDFQSGDRIRLKVVPSASPPPSQAVPCRVSASLAAAGGSASSHNSVVAWGSIAAATPVDGRFCGPAGGLKEGPEQCNATAPELASVIVPREARLAGLAVRLGQAATSAETYTVYNITQAVDTGLLVTVPQGEQQAIAPPCASNCTPAEGDLLTVRYNVSGEVAESTRHVAIEFDSIGALVAVRGQADAAQTTYGNTHIPWDFSPTSAVYRMSRAGRLQNLHVQTVSAPASPITVTVCGGADNPPVCGGPTCTIDTSGTSCRDGSGTLDLLQGQFFELALTATGGNPPDVGATVEIADIPSRCVGDCDGNGQVTVDELVTMVNIALDVRPVTDCLAGDANNDGQVTIDEIIAAVNNALGSCPSA